MSKGQTLRALVNERLTAVADEIFALFERTIAEYEEELCRSKEEKIPSLRAGAQSPLTSPGLNQEITETPRIKEEPEEQSVKQEEEQLPVPVPESTPVYVKSEEPSLQEITEHREEIQTEDLRPDPHFLFHTAGDADFSSDTDCDDDWGPSFSSSSAQMEIEVDEDTPESDIGDERRKYQCYICRKTFKIKYDLQRHMTAHTGEKPYSCSLCDRTFARFSYLKPHMRTHTGEKPYSCSICDKKFSLKGNLKTHMGTHTKPYSCSYCDESFAMKRTLKKHMKTHREHDQSQSTEVIEEQCQIDNIVWMNNEPPPHPDRPL